MKEDHPGGKGRDWSVLSFVDYDETQRHGGRGRC